MSREQDSRRKAIASARRDKAMGIKREELVGERNIKEGKNAISITYIQRTHK
jgi:hypothetical protein